VLLSRTGSASRFGHSRILGPTGVVKSLLASGNDPSCQRNGFAAGYHLRMRAVPPRIVVAVNASKSFVKSHLLSNRRPASSRLLGSRMGTRYRLQAHLACHFGLGPLQREWTCTSKLDPYRLAVVSRPRSSAVGLKDPYPSLHRPSEVCDIHLLESTDRTLSCYTVQHISRDSIVTMDYSYFSPPQQPYHHFMGISSNPYPHSGVDPDTIRSVVCSPTAA
jgi:hypothetical protein